MSTPEELTLALQAATDEFTPYDHKPTGDDVRSMEEVMAPPLFNCEEFDPSQPKNNLYGIIASKKTYEALYAQAFTVPPVVAIAPTYPTDAKLSQTKTLDAQHCSQKATRALYKAADHGAVRFIQHAVPETWLKALKHRVLGYTNVTAATMMAHLRKNAGGMHEVDAILIPQQMMGVWVATESIPEYINELEELQQTSVNAELPVTDKSLVAIANKSMIAHKVYPTTTSDFNKLPPAQRTWAVWKPLYLEAYEEEEREKNVSNAEGDPFGGAATHDNNQTGGANSATDHHPTDQMMDQLSGYLANLQAATTNSGESMQQLMDANAALSAAAGPGGNSLAKLVESNATLTTTNASQQKELTGSRIKIASLEKKLREQQSRRGGNADNANDSGSAIAYTITRKIGCGNPREWRIGGYCHKHGYGANHNSTDCRAGGRDSSHKKDATRDNTMGGCQDNKGWDSHLVGMPR